MRRERLISCPLSILFISIMAMLSTWKYTMTANAENRTCTSNTQYAPDTSNAEDAARTANTYNTSRATNTKQAASTE